MYALFHSQYFSKKKMNIDPSSIEYDFQFDRMTNKTQIRAVLIDLSGTVHVEDDPTPNAIHALQK